MALTAAPRDAGVDLGELWRVASAAALGVTAITLAFICLAVLIPPFSARGRAQFDAQRLLGFLGPPSACPARCGAEVLGQTRSGDWRVRLITPSWQRCFALDARSFGYGEAHGLAGVNPAACP